MMSRRDVLVLQWSHGATCQGLGGHCGTIRTTTLASIRESTPPSPQSNTTGRFPGNAAHHRCVSFCIEQPVLHLPQQRWRAPSKDTGIGKLEPVLADREADARAAECCTCAVEHTFQFSATKLHYPLPDEQPFVFQLLHRWSALHNREAHRTSPQNTTGQPTSRLTECLYSTPTLSPRSAWSQMFVWFHLRLVPRAQGNTVYCRVVVQKCSWKRHFCRI